MSFEVLKDRSQINAARTELKRLGVSQTVSRLTRLVRRLSASDQVLVGDNIKSWDVLRTLEFLMQELERSQPILDIGCYASEILLALHQAGFSNLTGADLNPDIREMPHQNNIRYEITDFMKTPFADASFDAITSISVIEHGFNQTNLLTEVSRLLAPGGFFIASFDYWPEKIDTTGVTFFDLDWKIFSQEEIDAFVLDASNYGLSPVGQMNYGANQQAIECGGKKYTFAWMVLRKSD